MTSFEAGKYPAEMGMIDVLKAEAERVARESSQLISGDKLAIGQVQYQVARLLALSPEISISQAKELNYIFETLQVAQGIIEDRKSGQLLGEF